MFKGLILLPNLLHPEASLEASFPSIVHDIVPNLNGLIAENEKVGRHYLMKFTKNFRNIPIHTLNEHTRNLGELIEPLLKGETWGLISDAGMPCLADPGCKLVALARMNSLSINAIPGPSSILLALMLSGLPAQSFTFHGYLPRDPASRVKAIRALKPNHTHICIEAPYRNDHLLKSLIETLPPEALLSVATNLTGPDQSAFTKKIKNWKPTKLGKIPAIYIFRDEKREERR